MNILYLCQKKDVMCDGMVEGDDGIFGFNEKILTEEDFSSLGFKIKMKYVEKIQECSFCGNLFDDDELLNLIEPEQLSRLFLTTSTQYFNARKSTRYKLLRCKAQSLFCLGKHTPIIAIMALKVISIIGPGAVIFESHDKWWQLFLKDMIKTETFAPIPITQKSRELYDRRFHITVEHQLLIEKYINDSKTLSDLQLPLDMLTASNHSMICCKNN
jgi:hypothetical protein